MTQAKLMCYLAVSSPNFRQEWYESASGDARRRKAQLRRAGFDCTVSPPTEQITNVGRVRMTLLTIPLSFVGVDIPTDNVEEVRL